MTLRLSPARSTQSVKVSLVALGSWPCATDERKEKVGSEAARPDSRSCHTQTTRETGQLANMGSALSSCPIFTWMRVLYFLSLE